MVDTDKSGWISIDEHIAAINGKNRGPFWKFGGIVQGVSAFSEYLWNENENNIAEFIAVKIPTY